MIITTTNAVEGRRITAYKGIVMVEAIMGANVVGQSMLMVSAAGTAVVLG